MPRSTDTDRQRGCCRRQLACYPSVWLRQLECMKATALAPRCGRAARRARFLYYLFPNDEHPPRPHHHFLLAITFSVAALAPRRSSRPLSEMRVTIRNLLGKEVVIEVDPNYTIERVKECIQAADPEAPRPELKRLLFGGIQLDGSRQLADYTIQDGSTIHLVARLLASSG